MLEWFNKGLLKYSHLASRDYLIVRIMILINFSPQSHSLESQFSGFYAVYMSSLMIVTGTEDIMLRGPGRKSTLLVPLNFSETRNKEDPKISQGFCPSIPDSLQQPNDTSQL